MSLTATYSPEDNKLRLYSSTRLDSETYQRIRAAGFIWAPKQDLFVAPMWTPAREDLLIELCGDVGDEDTSLVERAEERADRFGNYSEARAEDAEQARRAVHAIADNIPFGQPILIGHHSEKRARKDAEKIENGMRRAVRMWETSTYWKQRAAGAIRAAKYKELPAVRARRIKGLEADKRKQEREQEHQSYRIKLWSKQLTLEQAQYLAGNTNTTTMETYSALREAKITAQEASETVIKQANAYASWCQRWINHINNRLEYERAMLAESGGTEADKNKPEKGGGCQCWASPRGGWSYIVKVNRISVTVEDNWGNGGQNFTRTIPFDKLARIMSRADVEAARAAGKIKEATNKTGFYLMQSREQFDAAEAKAETPNQPEETTSQIAFNAMRESLRTGVQIVTASQLFPTPPALVERMIEMAGMPNRLEQVSVLEPSAGTGNIVNKIWSHAKLTAVEINPTLAESLRVKYPHVDVRCADFLACNGNLGHFDCILMNPPFENGADIKHITHALTMLKPTGRLIAICADGPRQNEALKPIASHWEELPEGTFAGTGVRTVLLAIEGC